MFNPKLTTASGVTYYLHDYGCYVAPGWGCSPGITASTWQGAGSSTMFLLKQDFGKQSLNLPMLYIEPENGILAGHHGDPYDRRNRILSNVQTVEAMMTGLFELEMGDGFLYRCVLKSVSAQTWDARHTCRRTYTLDAVKCYPLMESYFTASQTIKCFSTVPKTDCDIVADIGGFTDKTNKVTISCNSLSWTISSAYLDDSKNTLQLLGREKVLGVNASNSCLVYEWTDFPYLVPGNNAITVSVDGVIHSAASLAVTYYPTFI